MKQCIEVILINQKWTKCKRKGITQLVKNLYLCADCATQHKKKTKMMGTKEFNNQSLHEEEIGMHSEVPSIKQLQYYLKLQANIRETRKVYDVDYLSDIER